MKKCIFMLCILFASSALAAVPQGKDATSNSERYYSTIAEAFDSADILPPPPAFDSILFLHDKAMYEQGLTQRDTERAKMAVLDADLSKIPESLSEAFGYTISAQNTPELFALIGHLNAALGSPTTRATKQKYQRVRPYVLFNAGTCYPKDEERLRTSGSYPSGHTTRGWGVALVLAEINPQRKDKILQRGFEMGQSRVICGYHWQSDVDAGRLAGSASVAALHANPAFIVQLQKAKDEFARLDKSGKIAR